MYPRKRLNDLLLAAAVLRERIPDVPGSHRRGGAGVCAPARAASRARARRHGGAPRRSHAPELAVEYVSAHCFCLPTVQEGFGLVFAEAMAAGLPVVACRAAAVPEIVEDRQTGLLVNPRSPGELATALETAADEQRAQRRVRSGRGPASRGVRPRVGGAPLPRGAAMTRHRARRQHPALHVLGRSPLLGRELVRRRERADLRTAHRAARPQLHARRHRAGADRPANRHGHRPRRAQADRGRDRRGALRPRGPQRGPAVPRPRPHHREHRDHGVGAPGAEARRGPAVAGAGVGGPELFVDYRGPDA